MSAKIPPSTAATESLAARSRKHSSHARPADLLVLMTAIVITGLVVDGITVPVACVAGPSA